MATTPMVDAGTTAPNANELMQALACRQDWLALRTTLASIARLSPLLKKEPSGYAAGQQGLNLATNWHSQTFPMLLEVGHLCDEVGRQLSRRSTVFQTDEPPGPQPVKHCSAQWEELAGRLHQLHEACAPLNEALSSHYNQIRSREDALWHRRYGPDCMCLEANLHESSRLYLQCAARDQRVPEYDWYEAIGWVARPLSTRDSQLTDAVAQTGLIAADSLKKHLSAHPGELPITSSLRLLKMQICHLHDLSNDLSRVLHASAMAWRRYEALSEPHVSASSDLLAGEEICRITQRFLSQSDAIYHQPKQASGKSRDNGTDSLTMGNHLIAGAV